MLWHSATIPGCAFYLWQGALEGLLSVAAFALSTAILEGQVVAFGPAMSAKPSWQRSAVLLAVTALSSAVSAGLVAAGASLLDILPPHAADAIGLYLPSALLALGFLPQFREFLQSWSVEGYSFGVTLFDVVGSAGNTFKLLLSPGSSVGTALKNSMPFLLIIVMHGILLTIVAVISCSPRAPKDETKLPGEP